MKRKALFVGVNEYEDPLIQNLRFAVGDAALIFAQFKAIGFEAELMPNPTRSEVEKKVACMTRDMDGEGDVFLFYFAGHGFVAPGDDERLFCKDDFHEKLQYHCAGLSFAMLRDTTRKGGLNRIFILDACRANVFAGRRGGNGPRDLVPISKMMGASTTPAGTAFPGGHAIWRSCCPGQYALELEPFEHGVFSLAIDRVMTECREQGLELTFDKPFMRRVVDKMRELATGCGQMPEEQYSGNWPSLVLLNASRKSESQSEPARAVVVCPVCGRNNLITETFRCRKCGKDHLCLSHASAEQGVCASCEQVTRATDGTADDWRRREAALKAAIEAERVAAVKAWHEMMERGRAAAAKALAERKMRDEAKLRALKEADLKAKLEFARKIREANAVP